MTSALVRRRSAQHAADGDHDRGEHERSLDEAVVPLEERPRVPRRLEELVGTLDPERPETRLLEARGSRRESREVVRRSAGALRRRRRARNGALNPAASSSRRGCASAETLNRASGWSSPFSIVTRRSRRRDEIGTCERSTPGKRAISARASGTNVTPSSVPSTLTARTYGVVLERTRMLSTGHVPKPEVELDHGRTPRCRCSTSASTRLERWALGVARDARSGDVRDAARPDEQESVSRSPGTPRSCSGPRLLPGRRISASSRAAHTRSRRRSCFPARRRSPRYPAVGNLEHDAVDDGRRLVHDRGRPSRSAVAATAGDQRNVLARYCGRGRLLSPGDLLAVGVDDAEIREVDRSVAVQRRIRLEAHRLA